MSIDGLPIIGQPKPRNVSVGGVDVPVFDDPHIRGEVNASDAVRHLGALTHAFMAAVREIESLRQRVEALESQASPGAPSEQL